MKKLVMTVAVLACAASIVSAQTVTSANMVGYAKVQAVGGELTLVALNFETGGLTVDEILGSQLPDLSVVNLWDKSTGAYVTCTKGRAGFNPNPVVELGDAFWIKAAGTGTNEIILSGEVLQSDTNSVVVDAGLDASGYYYPVDTLWEDTDLATQAPDLSVLNVWNGTGYDTYTKGRAGWGAAGVTISVKDGFWLKVPSTFTWNEERPFTP